METNQLINKRAMGLIFRLLCTVLVLLATELSYANDKEKIETGAVFKVSLGSRVGYLIASNHGFSQQEVTLSPKVAELMELVDHMAFEAMPNKIDDALDNKYFRRSDGFALRGDIPDDLAARMSAKIQSVDKSLDLWSALKDIRLEFAAETYGALVHELLRKKRKEPRRGYQSVDKILLGIAQRRNLTTTEVEGIEKAYQAALTLNRDESLALLRKSIEFWESRTDIDERSADTEQFFRSFATGRLDDHYTHYRQRECGTADLARVCDKIVDARNVGIALGIEKLFTGRRKTPMVAIGALHLAGSQSVQSILKGRTFKVERVL
jgi:hypothetical protein